MSYIGIDIGGTNIRIGHGGRGAELVGYEKVAREKILNGQNVSESLAAFIKQYMDRHDLTDVKAIGIGLPSTLSIDRRTILQTPNIPGMDQIAIAQELEELLQIAVYPEKDTNMIFLHDARGLDYEGLALGIYVGTGIGNSLFINGKAYIGKHGVSGELGHIPVVGSKDICGCGNRGCSETVASGAYLSRLQKERFPETEIGELFCKHKEEPELVAFVENIAIVIATEINILDPEFVILGGGILEMKEFPKEALVRQIHEHCRKPYPEQGLILHFSTGGQQSGVIGAIIHAAAQESAEVLKK